MISLTKKQKIIIICVAAAVAVILAVVIPIAVVFGGKTDSRDTFTVNFDSRGGSAVQSYDLEEGATTYKPADPTYDGNMFVFSGWYTDTTYETPFAFGSAMPAHDITLYAYWLSGETRIQVTYIANGGWFDGGATEIVGQGKVGDAFVAVAEPVREGYKFGGWCLDEVCENPFTAQSFPVESFKLYANWLHDTANYAYVSFYGNDTLLSVVPVKKGEAIPEYVFADDIVSEKWYTNSEMTVENSATTASNDISLYTSYYTKGLVISGNTVTGYTGISKKVYIPSKYDGRAITVIGENAFYRSDNYYEIIDDEVVYGRVTEVVLTNRIVTISENAFYDCRYLTTVNLTRNVAVIGKNAFWHNERLRVLGDISGVTSIAEGTFTGCGWLSGIALPSELTSIGAYAFADCTMLSEVVIPASVTEIGAYAFDGCTSLVKVDIASTALSLLDYYAFRNCTSLESVIIRSKDTVEFGSIKVGNATYGPFHGCPITLKISVPSGTAYKTVYAEWENGSLADKFISM